MLGYDKREAEKERRAINPGSRVAEVGGGGRDGGGRGEMCERGDRAGDGWRGGDISDVNSLSG